MRIRILLAADVDGKVGHCAVRYAIGCPITVLVLQRDTQSLKVGMRKAAAGVAGTIVSEVVTESISGEGRQCARRGC